MISPSDLVTSPTTAFKRSSNSPLYLAPATKAPISKEKICFDFKFSGTSPRTIRWASPSAIAVLPTPGSPIKIGLFFVRRLRIWSTRRISSSRPITGSNLPLRARSFRLIAYFPSASYVSSADWLVTLFPFRNSSIAWRNSFSVIPASFRIWEAVLFSVNKAKIIGSKDTYWSPILDE